jgi:hypothetical protein
MSPDKLSADSTTGGITIESAAPQLWSVLFAREDDVEVVPGNEEEFNLRFALALSRPHARTVTLELTGILEGLPWIKERTVLVGYRMFFVVRGMIADEPLEALIRDLATRIGPSTIFPFIRETVHNLTGKTGNPIMLPMLSWTDRFDHVDVPPPAGETPPHLLEPVEAAAT